MKKIALVKCRNGVWQAFKNELENRNVELTLLDIFKYDDLQILLNNKWDGVIWTAKHTPKLKELAKRILYIYDQEPGTNVYPKWNSYFHYDDKIAQYFLFKRLNFPIPETHLYYDKEEALDALKNQTYPLVFKASDGAGSSNVKIIKSFSEAKKNAKKIFGKGLKTFFKSKKQKGYLLFQEFEKNNPGDYRLVAYGNEILGHFRGNRDEVPMASGSDKYEFIDIPHDLLDLIHDLYNRLDNEVMSFDVIKNNEGKWVIAEISVIYGNYGFDHYAKSKVYKLNEQKQWLEVENPGEHYQRAAKYVLDKWNLDE